MATPQGFNPNPAENTVRFNGTPAEVLSASATTLVAVVPLGATTGKISVQVGTNTAESSQNFTVTQAPVITGLSPKAALTGTTITNFRVTGFNLTGATFAFLPAFVPPAIVVNSASIDPSGTSATLSLTIGTQAGQFVLVATRAEESSDATAFFGNTFSVVDVNEEMDTDGDGFPDGLEGVLGSDPFDPQSIPDPDASIAEAIGATFSILNVGNPTGPQLPNEANSPTFSLLNTTGPTGPRLPNEADGPVFSILNTENPAGSSLPGEAVGPVFSIRNMSGP